MDQTDGSGVLACDGGLHRGGLAPGLQLSGVKSSEEEGGEGVSVRMVSQTWIRLTW